MLFNSLQFLIFFPVVCLVYFPLPQVLKKPWLLVCSYYFYMCWNAGFALLIAFSTLTTWLCGFVIEKAKAEQRSDCRYFPKLALTMNIAVNLGILFFFKYFDFFSQTIAGVFSAVGITYAPVQLGLTLPVGISFYTFQALGYSIDVYRGEHPHEKNLLNYALFVSFFPQLVAGPIERSVNFLPQLKQRHYFDERRTEAGVLLMLVGFFKKLVIADGFASLVDPVFSAPGNYSGLQLLLASVMFTLQIYGDFSGYSDIAIGAAEILGFSLMRNFDRPYFSASVSEFWRRWHISLSTWMRDYIYIPLGGNRRGPWRKRLNLLITFAISGLWHGAKWTFVIWGMLNGLYQCIEDMLRTAWRKLFHRSPAPVNPKRLCELPFLRRVIRFPGILLTFGLTSLTFIFFRVSTLQQAAQILKTVFSTPAAGYTGLENWMTALSGLDFFGNIHASHIQPGWLLTATGVGLVGALLVLTVLELIDAPFRYTKVLPEQTDREKQDYAIDTEHPNLGDRVAAWAFPARWLMAIILLGAILLWGSFAPSGFYYFQF